MCIYSDVEDIYKYNYAKNLEDFKETYYINNQPITYKTSKFSISLDDNVFQIEGMSMALDFDDAVNFAIYVIKNAALYFKNKNQLEILYMIRYFTKENFMPTQAFSCLIICIYYLEYIGFFDDNNFEAI